MELILGLFIIWPFLGFLISVFIPKQQERALFIVSYINTGIHLFASLTFVIWWVWQGATPINVQEISLYQEGDYNFFIDLYFDGTTAVYSLISSFLTAVVAKFSRYYLHREVAYKRFFYILSLFFTSIQIIILSGNFETLFIGWEVLGVSSFLLIAYYRHRFLAIRNALKVFVMYRIADVFLLIVMWLSHHLWHANITFVQLNNSELVQEHIQEHWYLGLLISIAILGAAAVKSAQLPFSSWLPKAMEGPTPSSAIFYGSVAVHIGAYLLMRTAPFWSSMIEVKMVIIAVGLLSAVVSTIRARVQPSVKGQIAYFAIAQIGLIFIEIALGLKVLAWIHLSVHAILRSYQLLISPSIVTYKIREQFARKRKQLNRREYKWHRIFRNTLFVYGISGSNFWGNSAQTHCPPYSLVYYT